MKKFIKFIHSLSVYIKLAFLIFVVIVIISSSVVYLAFSTSEDQTNEIVAEMIDSNIQSNKDYLTASILAKDNWALYKFVKSLSKNSVIKSVGIIDLNNIILAHTNTKKYRVGKLFENPQKYLIYDFKQDGILLSRFVFEVEKKSISNLLKKSFMNNFLFMTMAAVLSFIIAIYFMKNLLNRLDILVDNARAISTKRWDDIKEIQSVENDEITVLVKTITSLMKDMQQSVENEKITHSLTILGEISSLFAHEIKNLLQPLELLLEDGEDLDKEDMKIIHNTLSRMNSQVQDFLHLGQPIESKCLKPLHVKSIFEDIYHIIEVKIKEKNIKFEYEIDNKLYLCINEKSIELIVINLIKNSIEAIENGGLVSLKWKKVSNKSSLLRVQDNGVGIKPSDRKNLFKPFFTTKKNGSGLGLFSIYKVVYMLGGNMSLCDDELTTFEINFPIKSMCEGKI